MLTVTVRFYVTAGGIAATLLILLRIAFILGGFKKAFEDHLAEDAKLFNRHEADIRELRVKRR
jgi:hypothetical protein